MQKNILTFFPLSFPEVLKLVWHLGIFCASSLPDIVAIFKYETLNLVQGDLKFVR